MADLLSIIPKDTAIVKLKHPVTGETLTCDADDSEMFLEVYGKDSKRYRKVLADLLREKTGKKNSKFSTEQYDELTTEQLALCIASWNIEYEGEKPKYSKEKAMEIFDKIRWIREQAAEAIEDRADFLEV